MPKSYYLKRISPFIAEIHCVEVGGKKVKDTVIGKNLPIICIDLLKRILEEEVSKIEVKEVKDEENNHPLKST